MKKTLAAVSALILTGAVAGTAIGESHADPAVMAAVKARQAQMQLYAFNIGLLGGMAKGDIAYDAGAAGAAASNLAALTRMDQSRMWPQGSDTMTLGTATRALPDIWDAGSEVRAKGMALGDAAAAMEGAAGGGLDSLKGAMGALGGACGGCHKAYRQPDS
jgi:cytochrome c556